MEVVTYLNDVKVITPDVIKDERGFFMETFNKETFELFNLPTNFVQDNHSRSSYGTMRGLHFQWCPPMGKLMRVTSGCAYLVAVDIRVDSPWLGEWFGQRVSSADKKMIWAPAGFARGFMALSPSTEVQYKCTGCYNKQNEAGIFWNDPEIGIEWPLPMGETPIISEKDSKAQTLSQWLKNPLSNVFRLNGVNK
jgi:dTDP-4-dehydrorhamnose 3,5-epimerase